MSATYNTVVLVGIVEQDPEIKYTPGGGKPYTTIRLGIVKEDKPKLVVDVSVLNHQAELCCQFLKKGSSVLVSGELEKAGVELRVRASRVQFMDKVGNVSDKQIAEASNVSAEEPS